MFLTSEYSGYSRSGEQIAGGQFLVLASPNVTVLDDLPAGARATVNRMLFAGVFRVRMSQLGHFMMARLRLGGKTISLSGPYGGDGLPIDIDKIPEKAFHRYFVQVPPAIAEAYWTDARDANALLRNWARHTFPLTRRR